MNPHHFPINDTLLLILEDYIVARSTNEFSEKYFENRIRKLRKTNEEVHDILLELDFEWDNHQKEELALKNGKRMLLTGIIMSVGIGAFQIYNALVPLGASGHPIIAYGLIGASVLTAIKGNSEIQMTKHKRKRRLMKWRSW